MEWEALKAELAKSPFRSRFRLSAADRRYLAEKGRSVIEAQARRILQSRLAPAHLPNDGRQTPMRGHVVFIAQHATGCCCRSCLAKWHHVPAGRALTEAEVDHLVGILLAWIYDQAGSLAEFPRTPELF